jgi:DNA-binding XRE family transcriptional regulator
MKSAKQKKETKLKWRSLEQVVRASSSKEVTFKQTYDEELSRLRLAQEIRKFRSAKRLTQKTVADRAGMPQSVIARIESGTRGMSLDTLGKIAIVLGKKIELV